MCKEITVQEAIRQLNRYDCEFYTPANRMAHRMAIAAIKEQEERNNPKPLTIDELIEMCDQPVWVQHFENPECSGWAIVEGASEFENGKYLYLRGEYGYCSYEESVVAYRYKPKE